MIRITKQPAAEPEIVFRIEGALDAEGVQEFRSIIASSDAYTSCTVDISGVTSIQPSGIAYLNELRRSGCRLVGGSMYVNRLLGVPES